MKKPEECTRIRTTYRGKNLYIIIGDKRIEMSMENTDQFKTIAALSFIEQLLSLLLVRGCSLEEIASIAFENYFNKNDLPGAINDAIERHL